MIIGVTGGSGCGKTLLCEAAKAMGYKIIDADLIGHEILTKGSPAYTELLDWLGPEILQPSGEIDRRKLGAIVFSDPVKLSRLNHITHPKITAEIENRLTSNTVIDAAMLHKTPLFKKCDLVLAVTAPMEDRILRIIKRDHISKEAAEKRIAQQPTNQDYAAMADRVLINDGDEQQFLNQAAAVLKEVTAACQN
jgi:dephospho-CoA kinase